MRICSVKIGPICVPVRYRRLKGLCGQYEHEDRPIITVDSRLSEHQAAITVFHECIHAVFLQHQIRAGNEQSVRAAEVGVASVLIDNPGLARAVIKPDAPRSRPKKRGGK